MSGSSTASIAIDLLSCSSALAVFVVLTVAAPEMADACLAKKNQAERRQRHRNLVNAPY